MQYTIRNCKFKKKSGFLPEKLEQKLRFPPLFPLFYLYVFSAPESRARFRITE